MKKRKIPHLNHLHLKRKGLCIIPDDKFINKFMEIYNQLIKSNKAFKDKNIDYNVAKFFIICVCEAIIHSLDFGFDIWLRGVMHFMQRVSDYKINAPNRKISTQEDVRKITFKPISSLVLQIKDNVNKNNKKYQEYIEHKKVQYRKIKDYYKEFYCEKEWWQGNN